MNHLNVTAKLLLKTAEHAKKRIPILLFLVTISPLCAQMEPSAPIEGVPCGINRWNHRLGNHRVLIEVDNASAGVVRAAIPWRRRALDAAELDVVVVGPKKTIVKNRQVRNASRESAELLFEPVDGEGRYAVYYQIPDFEMVRGFGIQSHFSQTYYKKYAETASKEWIKKVKPMKLFPAAKLVAFEALERFGPEKLKNFNALFPMEIIATAEEREKIELANAGAKFLLFPEDAGHAIRMTEDLPYRWTKRKVGETLELHTAIGQYATFQIGVFALDDVSKIDVVFGDLQGKGGALVGRDKLTCFNLGGIDWAGRPFSKSVNIPKGEIQALWCGIDLPADTAPGLYEGMVTVVATGTKHTFKLRLHVDDRNLVRRGDDDPWNLSRLRWLNSRIGIDDQPVAPYTAIRDLGANAFGILGRKIALGESGLPASAVSFISMDRIRTKGREILASSMTLDVSANRSPQSFAMKGIEITKKAAGKVKFQTRGVSELLQLACRGSLESDGYMRYTITLIAKKDVTLDDAVLKIPFRKDVAKYAMGKFGTSGFMPKPKSVPIKGGMMNNVVWGGDYNAGLGCWLKNGEDEWNADNASKGRLPRLTTWENAGKGRYVLTKNTDSVTYEIHLGERSLRKGETLALDFALVITPFKPLTDFRWTKRIYHPSYGSMPVDAKAAPANIVNLHHATQLNPYINYPFIANKQLKEKVDFYHEQGKKVKIYYTVRELSVMLPELWALRSLGDEIYVKDGKIEARWGSVFA